jgi:type II secretory pathway predicted ATPase ExeA
MYLEFFKFSRKPFGMAPDPDFFYLTISAWKAYDRIVEAIQQREPCLLLNGEPGTGKTVLLNRLMAVDDSNVHWIFLNQPQLVGDELLVFIGQALKLSEEEYNSDHVSDRITEKLAEFENKGLYPVVLIDEANHLKRGTLQALLKWHGLNQSKGVAITIILAGLKRLTHTFFDADHELLATRLVDDCNLEKLDFQETCTFIAYRLKIVEYNGPALFEDDALKLIYSLSDGIPRVINLICDLGLVLAANRKQQAVTRQIIPEASKYLLLDKDAGSDEDSHQGYPAIDSAPVRTTRPRAGWRTPAWRWAVVGLLIMLGGGGTWIFMQSAQNKTSLGGSPPVTVQDSSNDAIEGKKIAAAASDPLYRAVAKENAQAVSSEPHTRVHEPETGFSQQAVVVPQPEKKPGDGSHKIRDPSGEMDQGWEARVGVPGEKEQGSETVQTIEDLPLAEEMIIDSKPDPISGDSVLAGDGAETRTPAFFPNETHSLDGAEPWDLWDSVARVDASNPMDPDPTDLARPTVPQGKTSVAPEIPISQAQVDVPNPADSEFTGLLQPADPKSPAGIGPEVPAPSVQILAKQSASDPQDRMLQVKPALPKLFKEKVVVVPPQNRKPNPAPKVYMAAIEPEISQMLTSEPVLDDTARGVVASQKADLIAAVENGNRVEVQQLIEEGVQVDGVNESGESALMKAAWAGRSGIITLLLSHEPRINQQSREGWTALFYGVVKGHKLVVASLLAQGAKPDLADQDGRTPLMAAAWNGHAEITKLLLDLNADPNRKNSDGWSALMFAALEGHVDVAKILLRRGADPSIKNSEGETSAQLAAHQGHTQVLSLLSTSGQP